MVYSWTTATTTTTTFSKTCIPCSFCWRCSNWCSLLLHIHTYTVTVTVHTTNCERDFGMRFSLAIELHFVYLCNQCSVIDIHINPKWFITIWKSFDLLFECRTKHIHIECLAIHSKKKENIFTNTRKTLLLHLCRFHGFVHQFRNNQLPEEKEFVNWTFNRLNTLTHCGINSTLSSPKR